MTPPTMQLSKKKQALALVVLLTFCAAIVALVMAGCSTEYDLHVDATDASSGGPSYNCIDKDGDGFGVGCRAGQDCNDDDPKVGNECYVCATGQPKAGCPCAHEGAHQRCGVVHAQVGTQVECGFGAATCQSGKWGDCVLDNAGGVATQGAGIHTMNLATAPVACTNNPCDPTCRDYPDTPDPSLTDLDAGIEANEAGIFIHGIEGGLGSWDAAPDGPINPIVSGYLNDAGMMPDGAFIYHELSPGQTSTPDTVTATTQVKNVDVYLLVDNSASMAPAMTALGTAAGGATGFVQQVQATFPSARFGVGHFHGYQAAPQDVSAADPRPVSPLWHTLDMQAADAPVANVLLWYGAAGGTSNNNTTEGVNSGLYASATTTGLFAGAGTPYATSLGYWVNPRNNPAGSPAGATGWDSDYGKYASASAASPPVPSPGEANGPCADPLAIGYPCFAPGAMPITLVFTDNPGEGGPGGLFAQAHGSTEATPTTTGGIPGSTLWPLATNVDGNHNGVEANAVAIDPTLFQRYRGSFTTNTAPNGGTMDIPNDSSVANGGSGTQPANDDSNFPGFVAADTATFPACYMGTGAGGREAFFKFTLTKGTFVHFDTFGSERDLSLYVFDRATRRRVACEDDEFWVPGAIGVDAMLSLQPSLDTYLKAGNYVLVVDEYGPPCPSGYFLDAPTGRCYRSPGSSDWQSSENQCALDGQHLISIRNATDDLYRSGNIYLVGLHNVAGAWQWTDGTPYNAAFAASMWDAGEPNLANGQCVEHYSNNKWRVVPCATGITKAYCSANLPPTSNYFLQVNAMDDSAPVGVPSFEQVAASENAIGGKVIGFDTSGIGKIVHDATTTSGLRFDPCDNNGNGRLPTGGTQALTNRWTFMGLQEIARRTGAVDGTNADYWTNPFVYALGADGQPCHATDPPLATQVVNAITQVTQTARQDVTVSTLDTDDLVDFDGTAGTNAGPTVLTPGNVNEGPAAGSPYGLFVQTVTAVPVANGTNGSDDVGPGGQKRCIDNPATTDVIEQCLPGTAVRFDVTFTVPATLVQLATVQIFKFDVQVRGSGSQVLGSQPAVIVVPPMRATLYPPADFVRTFDVTGLCPPNTAPVWGLWSWTASTPGDSKIDFYVTSADTVAGLATAPEDPLQFSNPPGPAANAGQPIGVASGTTAGSTFVQTTLALSGRPLYQPALRMRMHFTGSTAFPQDTPVLQGWNMEFSCPDTQ